MQVAGVAPTVFPRAQKSSDSDSPTNGAVRAALSHIASSTRLTRAEKQSFINLLGSVSDSGAVNPALMIKVMAIIALTESGREPGQERADPLALIEARHKNTRSKVDVKA